MKIQDFLWTCPYRKYLGIKCYGCGAQTAFIQLLSGDFSGAFHTYPAIYTLMVLAIIVVISYFTKKRKYQKLIFPFVILNLVVILFSYYLR